MNDEHISSAFDRDLETIQAEIMKMGGLVEQAIQNAILALVNRDIELSRQMRANDREIDALEESVNERAARVIALRAPKATDLRMLLSIFRISTNLERIADYAKNIARRQEKLLEMPNVIKGTQALGPMARAVEVMLKDALDAYIKRDVALATDVRMRDSDVDQMYEGLFRTYLTHMMEDPRTITPCLHLHFMAKNIERMGDHVTTIAEQVIYMVTGHLPDDERPKGSHPEPDFAS